MADVLDLPSPIVAPSALGDVCHPEARLLATEALAKLGRLPRLAVRAMAARVPTGTAMLVRAIWSVLARPRRN